MLNRARDMSLWEHIVELLTRIRRILYSLIICTFLVMFFPVGLGEGNPSTDLFYTTLTTSILRNLKDRFLPRSVELIPVTFFAPIEVYVFVSAVAGVILSLPVILYEVYKFINPALYENERRTAFKFIAPFVGLFILGVGLGYVIVVPMTMRTLIFLSELLGLQPTFQFSEFYSLVLLTLFLCGLFATSPMFLMVCVSMGIVKAESLAKNRKFLYAGIIMAIAIVDPDPSLITETFIGIPVIILMEITIFFAKRAEKERAA